MSSGPAVTYPWYDDRAKPARQHAKAAADAPRPHVPEQLTPKSIYRYLDKLVWKQDEAKRAAAMIAYHALVRGIKQSAFFVGPTGCGKTHIWRCLQELFPDRIAIVDASRLSCEGWNGSVKWKDMLSHPMHREDKDTILVMDEADKFLSPRHTSHGENVGHSLAGEGLKLLEGAEVDIKVNGNTYTVDTARISFILCGAFSHKAKLMADAKSKTHIGFDRARSETKAYDQPLTGADLMDYGVLPELVGRCQRVVNLQGMTEEDFFRMTDDASGPLPRLQKQYKVRISLTEARRRELAAQAVTSGLGVRGMENTLRSLLDDALFEDCSRSTFTF